LKGSRVVMEFTLSGRRFHSLGPRTANDLSYSVFIARVLDLGGEGILAFTPSLEEVVNWTPRSLGEMWCKSIALFYVGGIVA